MIHFAETMSKMSQQKNVFYIHHLGLSHFYLGNQNHHLLPETTSSPTQISPKNNPSQIGGNPTIASSDDGMYSLFFGRYKDALHLNERGFELLAKHILDTYLRDLILQEFGNSPI